MIDDDYDEDSWIGLYENGYWIWDDEENRIEFISTMPLVREETKPKLVVAAGIDFRDGIDIIEQMRFRRLYRRKVAADDPDVVTIQDVKDIAIYTAPANFLTPMLINFLHLPATDRFLRALMFYSQYYLQVRDQMAARLQELYKKIRTPNGDVIEANLRENLNDFRLLVAKEYYLMIYGADGYRQYHHMGADKMTRSMSFRDCNLYEAFLRMCVQIVWIGLNRKNFNRLELEIHRLFKTDTFNSAEHIMRTDYINAMTKEERDVLFGFCVKKEKKLKTRSPLVNEVFCERPTDHRLVALGTIKLENLPPRLAYLHDVLVCPEENLEKKGVVCGILGKSRDKFDIMLRIIEMPIGMSSTELSIRSSKSMTSKRSKSIKSQQSFASVGGGAKRAGTKHVEAFEKIEIPYRREPERVGSAEFPDISIRTPMLPYVETQRKRWLHRLQRQQAKDKPNKVSV